MKWDAKASIPLIAALSLLSGASQAAELGVAGGYFSPWSGDGGYTISAQLLASDPGERLRWGGEFEFRKYTTDFAGAQDVEAQDVLINALLHYRLFPEGWTPYGGLGLGLGLNIVDKKDIEGQLPLAQTYTVNKVGFLLGVVAVLGVEAPIGSHFSWYTEGRGNIYARIPGDGDVTFRNSSGWDARMGFRLRWR